jgi:hypothetical protein
MNDGNNQYPGPNPIPEGANLPPADSDFMISPALTYSMRGGYASTVDDKKYNNGGGIGVVLFMDGGRTGLLLDGQVAGTQGGAFAYAQGDLRVRVRIPFDPRHIIWGALGTDIEGRGAVDPQTQSYFKAQLPVALIGTMFSVNGKCVIHIFGKAAFGIFDNQTQAKQWDASLDTFARPSVGAETLVACGSIRIMGDYQHTFSFGAFGDYDKASLSYSQTWPVGKSGGWEVGFFLKGDYLREGGMKGMTVESGDPRGLSRDMGGVFTGLEVRWGAPAPWPPQN